MFQSPELNVADELFDLIFTDKDASPIKTPYLWQKHRRDDLNRKINCTSCNPKGSMAVEGQLSCPYCRGIGYFTDEFLIYGYMYKLRELTDSYNLLYPKPIGKASRTNFVLVTNKSVSIREEDKVSILTLNDDGKIKVPLTVEDNLICMYHKFMKASQKRSDYNVSLLGG